MQTHPAVAVAGSDARAAPPPVADPAWRVALQLVLREPHRLSLYTQPIVDLATGEVVGYEALSRFDGPISASPDVWFAAADHWGVNAQLQTRVLSGGVALRSALPMGMFLTVNIDPHLLTDARVSDALLEHSDLSCLVVELTEHTRSQDPESVDVLLRRLRERGAMIAMDDAGTGYAGLSQLLELRPHIVKLDRELIKGIDTDPVKRALMEVLGDLVGRMDGWVLAEGIETLGELDTVVRLGAALGQGFALARPAPTMLTHLTPDLAARIRLTAARSELVGEVISLVRTAVVGTDPATADVLLDADGRPTGVRWGGSGPGDPLRWSPAVLVAPSATLVEVARRCVTRAAADLPAPVVCTDDRGTVLGVVTQPDLLGALAGVVGSR